jgi:hypothetical protein
VAQKDPIPGAARTGGGVAAPPGGQADRPRDRSSEFGKGRLFLLIVLGLLLVGVLFEVPRTLRTLDDPSGPSRCPGLLGVRLSSNGTPGRYTLSPRVPDQVYQLNFGASRAADFVTVEFNQSGGTRVKTQVNRILRTHVSDFRRADGPRFHNPKGQIYTQAIIGNRDVVRLNTCFDPGSGRRVIPGTYIGTVTIDDRSLKEPVVVPIQVTLKYPDLGLPIVLVLIAALFATWLKALSDRDTNSLSAWLGQKKNIVALFFGIGAVAAVYATYLRSTDWGTGGLLDVGTIFAAAFAAHLAGLTAHQAGENSDKPTGTGT